MRNALRQVNGSAIRLGDAHFEPRLDALQRPALGVVATEQPDPLTGWQADLKEDPP